MAAQQARLHRARCNRAARRGEYSGRDGKDSRHRGRVEAMNFIALKMLLGDRTKYAGAAFRHHVYLVSRHVRGILLRRHDDPQLRSDCREPEGGRVGHGSGSGGGRSDDELARVGAEPRAQRRGRAIRRAAGGGPGRRPFSERTVPTPPGDWCRRRHAHRRAPDGRRCDGRVLRAPDAVIIDGGGTSGKLETPLLKADQWPRGRPALGRPDATADRGRRTADQRHPRSGRGAVGGLAPVSRHGHFCSRPIPPPSASCCRSGDG